MKTTPIRAKIEKDSSGEPRGFRLEHDKEALSLEPGRTWSRLDVFKWVTRGLIEEPQSFHAFPDGDVEINGHRIPLHSPDAASILELEINRRHSPPAVHHSSAAQISHRSHAPSEAAIRVVYHVKLDSLGHVLVEAWRHEEKFETGLRGLPHWAESSLMLRPGSFHVDPLQRHVEIDGEKYAADQDGVVRLENALNTRYSPRLSSQSDRPVEVRENPASPTGFDIHFWIAQSGARFEIKGHLNQERLDILQDPVRCGILKAGTLLRISPPKLLIRRRRPDGGEEPIPGLADIQYLKATAVEIQDALNHEWIRHERSGTSAMSDSAAPVAATSKYVKISLVKVPEDHRLLWMDCQAAGGKVERRAFTHHNVADLNSGHQFREGLDFNLSLDHCTLSLLNLITKEETHMKLDLSSSEEELTCGSLLLTNALLLNQGSDLKTG